MRWARSLVGSERAGEGAEEKMGGEKGWERRAEKGYVGGSGWSYTHSVQSSCLMLSEPQLR